MNQIMYTSTSLFHRAMLQSPSLPKTKGSVFPFLQNIIINNNHNNFSKSTKEESECHAIVDHLESHAESIAGQHGKKLSSSYAIESKRVLEKEERKDYHMNLLIEEEHQIQEKEKKEDENAVKLVE